MRCSATLMASSRKQYRMRRTIISACKMKVTNYSSYQGYHAYRENLYDVLLSVIKTLSTKRQSWFACICATAIGTKCNDVSHCTNCTHGSCFVVFFCSSQPFHSYGYQDLNIWRNILVVAIGESMPQCKVHGNYKRNDIQRSYLVWVEEELSEGSDVQSVGNTVHLPTFMMMSLNGDMMNHTYIL